MSNKKKLEKDVWRRTSVCFEKGQYLISSLYLFNTYRQSEEELCN